MNDSTRVFQLPGKWPAVRIKNFAQCVEYQSIIAFIKANEQD